MINSIILISITHLISQIKNIFTIPNISLQFQVKIICQLFFQFTIDQLMNQPQQLYPQSQEQIIPIIDFIPINSQSDIPESTRWCFKSQLDESHERPIITDTLLYNVQSYIDKLEIGSSKNDFDKKTTSIMQGVSINSISSNEHSLRTIKDNLKSYLTNINEKYNNNGDIYIPSRRFNTLSLATKTHSIQHISNLKIVKERKRILQSVEKTLAYDGEHYQKANYKSIKIRRQRQQLLKEIVSKLQIASKTTKPITLLRQNKSNDKSSPLPPKIKQVESNFNKKNKKWVQMKNSLKEAASISATKCPTNSHQLQQHQIINRPISQWQQAIDDGNNNLPISVQTATFDDAPQYSSNFTSNKQFPSQKQQDIFSFNNLKNNNIQRHIKNVSIEVEQNSEKQLNINDQSNHSPVINCVLCKIIGKRCSFH